MKFGMSEAVELLLELVIKEAPIKGHKVLPQKVSQEGEMKFNMSEAVELPLKFIIEEVPTKGHEVLS